MDDLAPNYLQALTHGKDIFLLGDLNCNMLKDIPESWALREFCTCLNLSQLITSPTRVTERSSSLIDVIMTSNSSLIIQNGTLDAHLSDHYLVFSVLNLKIPKAAPVYITARNYKNYDSNSFLKDLTQINWSENTRIDDCNGKVEHVHFNFHFQHVLNRHAPVKSMKIRYRKCPFVSKEFKRLMSLRNKKREIARRTGLPEDWQRQAIPSERNI